MVLKMYLFYFNSFFDSTIRRKKRIKEQKENTKRDFYKLDITE